MDTLVAVVELLIVIFLSGFIGYIIAKDRALDEQMGMLDTMERRGRTICDSCPYRRKNTP